MVRKSQCLSVLSICGKHKSRGCSGRSFGWLSIFPGYGDKQGSQLEPNIGGATATPLDAPNVVTSCCCYGHNVTTLRVWQHALPSPGRRMCFLPGNSSRGNHMPSWLREPAKHTVLPCRMFALGSSIWGAQGDRYWGTQPQTPDYWDGPPSPCHTVEVGAPAYKYPFFCLCLLSEVTISISLMARAAKNTPIPTRFTEQEKCLPFPPRRGKVSDPILGIPAQT